MKEKEREFIEQVWQFIAEKINSEGLTVNSISVVAVELMARVIHEAPNAETKRVALGWVLEKLIERFWELEARKDEREKH